MRKKWRRCKWKQKKEHVDLINSTRNWDSSSEHRTCMKLPKLPEFRKVENKTDTYLLRFERYTENMRWNLNDCALSLSSVLTGRTLEMYCRLLRNKMNDYVKLKQALLVKFTLTEEDFREAFLTASRVMARQLRSI